MCGIIGYSGHRPAVNILLEGLKRLEYRGYDSAGMAFPGTHSISVVRAPGKLAELEKRLTAEDGLYNATIGIGHTRWATHGAPVEKNAHPHRDSAGRLALVHNGIIENFQELKAELLAKGYTFASDTDTEVLSNLLADTLAGTDSMEEALRRVFARVEGTYAVAVCHLDHPGKIWGVRQSSPLVLGLGIGENYLASDIPAFLPYTREVVFLDDGELVRISDRSWDVLDLKTLTPVAKTPQTITWDVQAAQKGGYKHFMLKEIFEQPKVIRDCLAGRLDRSGHDVRLPELDGLPVPSRVHIIACGTSYHAGLWSKYLIERWAGIPVDVEIASEFRYRSPVLEKNGLAVVISQSGETIDTLEGLREARRQGVRTLGICNVVGSTIAREADHVIHTQAGPEISVASTKAMCSQMVILTLFALSWGRRTGKLPEAEVAACVEGLETLPGLLEQSLPEMRTTAQELAVRFSDAKSFFFLGRGLCYPLALEGALKLKEISYIHAEGYAAGEMKHGPIALIDPQFPTFALALNDELLPKVKSNLIEVKARSGEIVALLQEGADVLADHPWVIPSAPAPLSSFLALPALQLFAYEVAEYLGKDVDQPRNLAKSVTVE